MAAKKKPSSARPARSARHWLVKSDPEDFSFDDLLAAPKKRTSWTGVRNFQARNFLREMAVGDLVLVYHSGSERAGVVGLARISRAAGPDPTQFERGDEHFDPKSTRAAPTWLEVELQGVRAVPKLVELSALKANPALARMRVVQRGSRLSVQPVEPDEWAEVLRMAGLDPGAA